MKFVSYTDHENEKKVSYRRDNNRIFVHILEEVCGLKAAPGTVLSLQIETQNKKKFTFKTGLDDPMIHIEIIDEEKPNIPYNASIIKSKWQLYLSKEICYKETSTHYENMLKILSTIDGLV